MKSSTIAAICILWLAAAPVGRASADEPGWAGLTGTFDFGAGGVYGVQGVSAASNRPGVRSGAVSWTSGDGKLYLFGGTGESRLWGYWFMEHHNDLWKYDPTTTQWTWLKGAKARNEGGTYGTQGVPGAANTPGGRHLAASWMGDDGKLYLFGGEGFDSTGGGYSQLKLSDLWRYDPSTTQWTWLKGSEYGEQNGVYGTQGVANAANAPGARYGPVSWKGADGKLYLFGGYGLCSTGTQGGFLNDLWKYDPSTNQWTWLKGSDAIDQNGVYGTRGLADPANTPGGRVGAAAWTGADGKLYLFGGDGLGGPGSGLWGDLNDLWRYDPSSNQWTWLKGADVIDQGGVYGTKGVPADANLPGGRYSPSSWTGPGGGLYLFGGSGRDSGGSYGLLNDLWKYDPSANQWTWLKGSDIRDPWGVYGTRGFQNPANTPGGRREAVSWRSGAALYLFGGRGNDASWASGELNDLWLYDIGTDKWAWLKGAAVVQQVGEYGMRGVADPANTPGARLGGSAWTASDGNSYLFGGWGWDLMGLFGYLNDLWKYDPAANQWTWLNGLTVVNQNGVYGTRGVPADANTPGSRDGAVSWAGADGKLYLFGGYGCDGGTENDLLLNDLWRYDPTTNQWTWLKGAAGGHDPGVYGTQGVPADANTPGSREGAAAWTGADGKLYLFGGEGCDGADDVGSLNDLWRFDPTTTQWTWLKGSNERDAWAWYGARGVPHPANTPGGRKYAVSMKNGDGKLYLFGGLGHVFGSGEGLLNDLWEYDPSTNQWTWLNGAESINQIGVYGTQGAPDAANTPGSRFGSASWTSGDGRLYLFGGNGYDGSGATGDLNDLWWYNPASNQWTWLKGATVGNQSAVCGTRGVSDEANSPGGRESPISWTGADGKLYLFGGFGFDGSDYAATLGDLWRCDALGVSAAVHWQRY